MTRDEMTAEIHRQLGFRSDQSANILLQIPVAIRRLENAPTKPWFLLSEYTTSVTVIEEGRLALPDDFIEEHDEDGLSIYSDDDEEWIPLVKNDLDTLQGLYGSTSGFPTGYALTGNYFRFFPIPDEIYTLRMLYFKRDDELVDGTDTNGFLTHVPELLMGRVGLRIAQALRDKDAIVVFREMITEGGIELYRQNESRKHANASYQMGGAH